MKKIVIACDSMKGSLTSAEVARAAHRGVLDVCPDAEVVTLQVADGGEGTATAITAALGGQWVEAHVAGPLRSRVVAGYGVVELNGIATAVIDMASASGLTLIAHNQRNPLLTTSYGTGQLMAMAWDAGCRQFMIGIGGSATNDGGKGMLEALGIEFLDDKGVELCDGGGSLSQLTTINTAHSRRDILGAEIIVMCDVANPLCGPDGASAVHGPQKGATEAMVAHLDAALRHFSEVVADATGRNIADMPGAGAAGGLGAAFLAFTDAKLQRGVDTVLNALCFDDVIADADLVITGEGCLDRQTLNGKVPIGVLQHCVIKGVLTAAIAGKVANCTELSNAGFGAICPIHPHSLPLSEAMDPTIAASHIRSTVSRLCRQFL